MTTSSGDAGALEAALARLQSEDVSTRAAALTETAEACLALPSPPFDRVLAAMLRVTDPPGGKLAPREIWEPGQEALQAVTRARAKTRGWRVARPAELAAMDDHDLIEAANTLLWYGVSIYDGPEGLQAGLEQATPGQRALFCIVWLESEVNNGGFLQLLWNPTGVVFDEALAGLGLIGAAEHAALLRAVAAQLPGGRVSGDRDERQEAAEAVEKSMGEEERAFDAQDERFYELNETDRSITALLAAYIRAHPDDFFEK